MSVLGAEVLADLGSEVIVHDVLEVDLVKIVSPWVQHGEALVLDALGAILEDVVADEGEVRFVSVNWVTKIILNHLFFDITDEGSDGPDARGTL